MAVRIMRKTLSGFLAVVLMIMSIPMLQAQNEEQVLRNLEKQMAKITADYKKTGIWTWPDYPQIFTDYKLSIQKTSVAAYKKKFSALKITETEHFLILSDAPTQKTKKMQEYLEKMYESLGKTFNLPMEKQGKELKRKNIYSGKCVVVFFSKMKDFYEFEQQFFKLKLPNGINGINHTNLQGDVTIAACSKKKDEDTLHVLLHETTHGFLWMYKTAVLLPNWLNEGLAEQSGERAVPNSTLVDVKKKGGVNILKKKPSLKNIFSLKHIEPWHYGIACMLVEFLQKKDSKAFYELVTLIKKGDDPEKALKKTFKMDYTQFATEFGNSIGVKNLKK